MAADVKICLTDWLASNDRMTNRPDIHSDIKYQGREWQGIYRLTDRGIYRLIDHKNLSMWLIIYQLTKKVWLQLSFFTHSSHCFQMSWIVFRFCGPWVKFEIYHKLTNLALRNTKHNQKFPSDQRTSCPAGICPLLAWWTSEFLELFYPKM